MVSFANIQSGNNTQEWLEDVAFVTRTMCDPNEPQTFQQAWWNSDENSREKWHEAIRLEFNKMIQMGVWREVNKEERNANNQLVGSKWVFKINRNGVYGARLVAKGFRQIPGEDFTDRIPSNTPGAEPPRDAKDSGSARSHSTHLETSSSDRP